MTPELFDQARRWVELGIAVIPVRYREKQPDGRVLPGGQWARFQKELPTEKDLRRWFCYGFRNLGVVCGWNNLVVLDFESVDGWLTWKTRAGFESYSVITRRGVHTYLFSESGEVPNVHRRGEIDIQGPGRYVLGAGSVHPTGAVYMALDEAVAICRVGSVYDVLPEARQWEQEAREAATTAALSSGPGPGVIMPVNACSTKIYQDFSAGAGLDADPWAAAERSGEDLITTIKRRFRLLSFFSDAEKTDNSGRWWVARCPFHDDHNPSFWIDAARNLGGCYAGCGTNIDVINFVARRQGISNRAAIEYLRGLL